MNSPIGGRYGGGSGQAPQSTDAAIGEIVATLRSQGREMKEVRRELKEIGTTVTQIKAQLPNLVTEKGCHSTSASLMTAMQELKEQSRKHTDNVAKDLKDRMDGRREVTGVHRTVPEIWSDQAGATGPNPAIPRVFEDPPAKKPRGARYWITLTAALLALGSAAVGVITYVRDRLERDERMEQMMLEMQRRLPAEIESEDGSATARFERKTSD